MGFFTFTTIILILFVCLFLLHFGIPYLYYLYMKKNAEFPPDILIDEGYEPNVSLIVATYNESSIIERKLKNLKKTNYPKEKLEIIIVDSSSDNTVEIVNNYLMNNDFPFEIKILEEKERRGKSKALNYALENVSNKIIALSDADSFWEPDSLKNFIKYMHDPKVGALTGNEKFLNLNENIYTQAEGYYREFFYNPIREGESNLHSTMMFQGECSIYKKDLFERFNEEKGSDDIGTVINLITKNYRTIFVPEAIFWDTAPTSFNGRVNLKMRRALHVILGLLKALKLKRKNMFPQPSLILYSNYYIHIINPLMVIPLIISGLYTLYYFPLLVLFSVLLLIKQVRVLLVSYITSNISLLLAIISYLKGEEHMVWRKIEEMREHKFEDPEINELLF